MTIRTGTYALLGPNEIDYVEIFEAPDQDGGVMHQAYAYSLDPDGEELPGCIMDVEDAKALLKKNGFLEQEFEV